MNLKRILAAVTAAVVVAGSSVVSETTSLLPSLSLTASAEIFEENGFYYTVTDGNATITGYSSAESNVTIPKTLGGYTVTSIGDDAFFWTDITSVVIPDSVKTIGEDAFGLCESLESISIPNSVTSIGEGAFESCISLTSIKIPESVTAINKGTFHYCSSLKSIYIPGNVLYIYGDNPFLGCKSLTDITVSEDCVYYSSDDGILFSDDKERLISYPAGKTDTSYTVPGEVYFIEDSAFNGCDSLESVIISDGVGFISEYAFRDCTSLSRVVIPESVDYIGSVAFYSCTALKNITIPKSVKDINSYTFGECSSLTCLTISNSETTIGEEAFAGCDNLNHIHIPHGTTADDFMYKGSLPGNTNYYYVLNTDGSCPAGSSCPYPPVTNPVPQNVKATAGVGKVTLTWDAVSGATKYRVQRLNGSTWATVATPTTAAYTDTNVVAGTTYSYRVLSYVDGTWSAVSAVAKATPVSAVPQNVKAVAGDKNVAVTWGAVSGATKYRVQRLNGSTWATIATPTTATYTDAGLTNGTTYSYRVLSYVDGAWSGVSAVVKATPASTVPQNVKATAGDKQVTVTWSAVNGATKYRVQRLNGSTWATVATPTAATYTDTGLTNGTTYSYRVLAQVNGAWSGVSAVAKAAPKVNIIPQNVSAAAGAKSVTVTWSAVEGASQYRVQRLNGSTWTTINYPKTNSFTDTGLTAGTEYSYRVLAQVDGAWSGVSAVAKAVPTSDVPQNIGAMIADDRVLLYWDEVAGATQYRIQRLNGTTWTTVGYSTTLQYTDTNLSDGVTYSYRILAKINGAWGGVSEVFTVTTIFEVPVD
ncbi:MAG: leucine-rich repeat protein [Oscillospiraceae bacterium]